jgi:hypothetical protein
MVDIYIRFFGILLKITFYISSFHQAAKRPSLQTSLPWKQKMAAYYVWSARPHHPSSRLLPTVETPEQLAAILPHW